MGIAFEQMPVLEGAGLALVDVHGQQTRRRLVAQDAPLAAGRETGAAQPPQLAVFQQPDDVLGRIHGSAVHLDLPGVHLSQQLVTAPGTVPLVVQTGRQLWPDRAEAHALRDGADARPRHRVLSDHRNRGLLAAPHAGDALHPNPLPQGRAQPIDQRLRPCHRTGDRVADPYGQCRWRGTALLHHVEVVVEGGDLVHLHARHPQFPSQGDQMGRREMAVPVLDPVQVLDQEIPPARRIAEQRPDLVQGLRVYRASLWPETAYRPLTCVDVRQGMAPNQILPGVGRTMRFALASEALDRINRKWPPNARTSALAPTLARLGKYPPELPFVAWMERSGIQVFAVTH